MMQWIKKGLIFKTENNHEWMQTHAQVPFAHNVNDERLRIYFGTRDKQNQTTLSYIEVNVHNLRNVVYIHDKPLLKLGKPGSFDDRGIMPSWIVDYQGRTYLYYIGWNVPTTVSYHLALGLAVSDDGGSTFQRFSEGPILERSIIDPYFVSNPCILIENGIWRMWYLSCTKWEMIASRLEPFYHIKYAESNDGIHWKTTGQVCIDLHGDEGGISRPSILKEGLLYKMWYSYRGASQYRENKKYSYRIGYAESKDGIKWERRDDIVGIDVSQTGWDSEMIAYSHVYPHQGQKIMLYNGNGFGYSGFGYATLLREKREDHE